VARGSGLTCHWMRPNVPRYWNSTSGFDFDHITAVATCHSVKFYPNRTALGRKKWHHIDFQDGGSLPSWILEVQYGFFEKSMYDFTSYRSSLETRALV